MAYTCHKCEAPILVLRLGYCSNCREPISSEILPESKKQELLDSEREYERQRELKLQQKDKKQKDGTTAATDINKFGL
jgi:ferredoxin